MTYKNNIDENVKWKLDEYKKLFQSIRDFICHFIHYILIYIIQIKHYLKLI